MKSFVYVLVSTVVPKSYVGMTDNIERRLQQHNSGAHAYTKRHMPWKIIHHEQYENRAEARKREVYLKSAAGRRFLKKHVLNC